VSGTHDETEERIPQRAMRELLARVERSYQRSVSRLWEDLLRYVSTKIVPGTRLTKAEDDGPRKFSLLTPEQLEAIKTIVREHHLAFAVTALGNDAVPVADLKRLQRAGLVPLGAKQSMRVVDLAYLLGKRSGEMQREDPRERTVLDDASLERFVRYVDEDKLPTTRVDEHAMQAARTQAGQYIRGIGERLAHDIGVSVLDADAEARKRYIGSVQRELESAIDRKAEWRKLASTLAHETQDWGRDMHRLAATEMQSAMEEGTARALSEGRNPKDIRVARLTQPSACERCVEFYRTAGHGSPPRIFTLHELAANGTNVGRRAAQWKPVLGPTHPWCFCTTVEVPDGWGFNAEGHMVPESLIGKSESAGHVMPYVLDLLEKAEDVRPHMTHDAIAGDSLTIRIADPRMHSVVAQICKEAPPALFRRDVGVTLITTDHPRAQNPLDDHDFAYWTGNEIRLSQTLPIERLPRVLRHELGHAPNVYLMRKLGSASEVRAWHDRLWEISKREGWCSDYADRAPIENAAEVTRMYMFERPRLMLSFPRQFTFVHRGYDGILDQPDPDTLSPDNG
jgi:hypothetical protein